jgi:ribonuclease HI
MQAQATIPHYLLFTDAVTRTCRSQEWRFALQRIEGGERVVASDVETDADGMRLSLLAVVRGLEALDGPSRVTLLVANRFVRRGIRRDLAQWRERGWRWERFGQLVPIRDLDLWQRVDRALSIHDVECFAWNADEPESCGEAAAAGHLSDQPVGGEEDLDTLHDQAIPRTYLQRRQNVAAAEKISLWGQEMLDSLTGLGRTALSRTA